MNAIAEIKNRELSVDSVQETLQNKRTIQRVMESVMKVNTHYGVIPGCKQPSLYKAGSEALLSTFHISADPIVEEMITRDDKGRVTEIKYRVKCIGRHAPSDAIVGYGIGEASTGEDKYAWRRAVCEEEFSATEESHRRVKWSKYQGKTQRTDQVRISPSDMSNTVLKMAKKRAQIDMTLTTLGCSDIFAQDLEDIDETLRENFSSDATAAPVDAGPPVCPDETFKENKPKWKSAVDSGKKTAESLLTTLETRAKFTDAQRAEILSWKSKPASHTAKSDDDFDKALDASGDYVPE